MKPCTPPTPDDYARLRDESRLHTRNTPTGPAYCEYCRIEWPCPTVVTLRRIIDGSPTTPCGRGPCCLGHGHAGDCQL